MDDMLAAGLLEELRDFHRRYNREKVAENRWVRSQFPFCSHSHLTDPFRARTNSPCSTSNVLLLPALSWQHLLLQCCLSVHPAKLTWAGTEGTGLRSGVCLAWLVPLGHGLVSPVGVL